MKYLFGNTLAGRLIITIYTLCIASAAASDLPDDLLRSNLVSATNQLHQIFSNATIRVTNGTINVSDRITVHIIPKATKIGVDESKQIQISGPETNGFAIGVRFRNGTYNETLYRTRVPVWDKTRAMKRGPFFYTAVVKEWPERPLYMAVDIQFGADVDTNKVERAYQLILDAVEKTVSDSNR